MRIKALVFLLLAPLLAWGQIAVTAPGAPIAIGAGVQLSIPSYDADAIAYFSRAGVTDATAKRQISDFVKGIKTLGLWSNMVCWPLRSSQNAGTGTTVYSLGGLGTYNGTLVNGPTWGASGITFASDVSTGRNRVITVAWGSVSAYDIRSNSTVIVVANTGEQEGGANFDQCLFGGGATANGRYAGMNARDGNGTGNISINGPTSIGNANYAAVGSQTLAAGTFRMWTTQRENNLVGNTNVQGNKLFRDTTQIANGSNAAQVGVETIATASEQLIIGNFRGNTSNAPVGEISFVAVISDWTVSPTTFRALLKSTVLSSQLP